MNDTADPDALKPLLARVADGHSLDEPEAEEAFGLLMTGVATSAQIGAFLMALRVRGETVPEITGAARVMRAKALTIQAPETAVDTCGTGGDAKGTYNISTAAALVVAGCGVPVAKHGNRALSSRSGSADVLTALGVNIDVGPEVEQAALAEAGLCFLMAPRHHSAMRHVGPTRQQLGTRTIFNLLGPLSNPAGTRRQVVGVYDGRWVEPLAEVLGRLGAVHAWVVHGEDGLDELTVTGPSQVAVWRGEHVTTFRITPEDLGLNRYPLSELRGGDATENAEALRAVLAGAPGAYRECVALNAGAALVVADQVPDLRAGVARANAAIDDGQAAAVLERLVAVTHRSAL